MAGRIFWLHKPAPPHLSMLSLFFSPLFFLSPSSSPILSSLEGTLTSGRNHSPGHFIILQCQTLLGRQFFCGEFPQPWYVQGHSLSWLYNFSCSIFVFFYKRILMELKKLRTLVLHHLYNSVHWMDTVGEIRRCLLITPSAQNTIPIFVFVYFHALLTVKNLKLQWLQINHKYNSKYDN